MEDDSIESNVEIITNRFTTKRWQWIILIFSALNVIFLGGKRRAFGIFIAELHNGVFNSTSLAELNWIGDSYAAVGYLSVGLSTWLIIRFGRRYRLSQFCGGVLILMACIFSALVKNVHWLFLTHTLLHGAGSSLVLATVGLVIGEYFPIGHEYHVLATTMVSGGSLASVVFVAAYAGLIEACGWRGAFIVLGFIYATLIWMGAFVFRGNASGPLKYNSARGGIGILSLRRTLSRIGGFRYLLIFLWIIDRILTSIVTYGMLLNLADYVYKNQQLQFLQQQFLETNKTTASASYLHYPHHLTDSASLTMLFAAGEAVTYLLGAVASALTKHWFVGKLKLVLLISSIFMGLFMLLWELLVYQYNIDVNQHNTNSIVLFKHYSWTNLLSFLSGLCLGPSITFLFPAGEEMTLLPGEAAYPLSLAGMGVGMLLSPLLSAMIAQRFKYRWFFLVQGCIMLAKSFVLLIGCLLLWYYGRRTRGLTTTSTRSTGVGGGGEPVGYRRSYFHSNDRELLLDNDDDYNTEGFEYSNINPNQIRLTNNIKGENTGGMGESNESKLEMKRDNSSFLPLPQTEDGEFEYDNEEGVDEAIKNNNGWDRIELDSGDVGTTSQSGGWVHYNVNNKLTLNGENLQTKI